MRVALIFLLISTSILANNTSCNLNTIHEPWPGEKLGPNLHLDDCVSGVVSAVYTENKDMVLSLSKRFQGNLADTIGGVSSRHSSWATRIQSVSEIVFFNPLWMVVKPSDHEREAIQRLTQVIKQFAHLMAYGSPEEIEAFFEDFTRGLPDQIKQGFLSVTNDFKTLMTDKEMGPMRSSLVCGFISSIGLAALITYLSAGALSPTQYPKLMAHLASFKRAVSNMKKVSLFKKEGRLESTLDLVNGNGKNPMTQDQLIKKMVSCAI